ncbi:Gmad2 immunoglobulin-like domain-containing protein [Alkaliphilus hydrothermalis]|uniref:Bacterial spore germination immunoglobulin-like domain-containing protein n=1 Tax=Alkaliphilus hydrothermalis TaxID=1482730 RepID=A0ABS2NSV7_9FIRM|nr:Gmad2 immunoglobulin-like domain-containing protein [Alkaliphilus hydrothermalis]MBM7615957.1 hypothetical protein [Alkaliphilus hydrothermalis]
MKKILSLLLGIFLSVNILGCQPKNEATPTPPVDNPPVVAEYPYDKLQEGDITGVEVLKNGEKSKVIEDEVVLQEIVSLIQDAEFFEVNKDQPGEVQLGMVLYLQQEILESNQISVSYVGGGNKLAIGPNGQEYLIESQELVNYIQDYQLGKIVMVEEKDISEGARAWFGQFLQEKGAYIYQHPDATYVKVVTEQKPTGGYRIHLRAFEEVEYPRQIIIEIKKPGANELVTEAITFPTAYFKIESDQADQYEIKTTDGEVYQSENKLIFAGLEAPQENSKIDNPVRMKGKIIAFEGAFVVRILDKDGKLIHEENLQADHGGPNWGTFDVEIGYPEPTTPQGSIELGEYSAKDGTYQLREKIEVRFK